MTSKQCRAVLVYERLSCGPGALWDHSEILSSIESGSIWKPAHKPLISIDIKMELNKTGRWKSQAIFCTNHSPFELYSNVWAVPIRPALPDSKYLEMSLKEQSAGKNNLLTSDYAGSFQRTVPLNTVPSPYLDFHLIQSVRNLELIPYIFHSNPYHQK